MKSFLLESFRLEKSQRYAARLLWCLPPLYWLPPKLFRAFFLTMDRIFGLKKIDVAKIIDYYIPVSDSETKANSKIKLRAYYPKPSIERPKIRQSLVYFHGGGGVIGSIETHDRFCRFLAQNSHTIILSVDYRLAPEHKFPTPLCDAIDGWNWINTHYKQLELDPNNIAVGGDSAGAYLACVISQPKLQKESNYALSSFSQFTPSFQFLLYPMLSLKGDTESYRKFGKHLILTNKVMTYFSRHLLSHQDETLKPLVSPIFNPEIDSSIPCFLLTLGFDPLRDDGIEYVQKLKSLNTTQGADNHHIQHTHYPDCMHGFISITSISKRSLEACYEVANALKEMKKPNALKKD